MEDDMQSLYRNSTSHDTERMNIGYTSDRTNATEITQQLFDIDRFVVQIILEMTLLMTHAEVDNLYLYVTSDPDSMYIIRHDNQGHTIPFERIDSIDTLARKITQGPIPHVVQTRQIYHITLDAQTAPSDIDEADMHSEIAIPLLLPGGELIGVLAMESRQYAAFADNDVEVLQQLAGKAATAIQHAQIYSRAAKAYQRLQILHQAGQSLAKITHISQLDLAYDIVLRSAQTSSNTEVFVYRYDPSRQTLGLTGATTAEHGRLITSALQDDKLHARVVRERRTAMISDQPPLPDVHAENPDQAQPIRMVVPIQFEHHYYGNVEVNHKQAKHFLDPDISLIEGLAQQLALTIFRLETAWEKQQAEQRAAEAEIMSSIGISTMELTHRLGNDLGLVRPSVNKIRRTLTTQGIADESIDRELERIVGDVRRVLEFSTNLREGLATNLEDLSSSPPKIAVSVKEALEEVPRFFPNLPPSIDVKVEVDNDIPPIYVVHIHLVNILHNLFSNAVEAMPSGGTITLRATYTDPYVEIQIVDTGIGIQEPRQHRIFDLFYSTKGSSGFGLWSARRFALANGGELTVSSQPKVGTVFTLRLPQSAENRI
ncbi:MAG TPA: GAF domain-containing protein [Herpetosiphonaceae bacterium]